VTDAKTPLYLTIAESIRHLIASGELQPGDQLPTIRALAACWGCTPGTVNRAYGILMEESLVIGRRGAGTRVTASALQDEPPPWRWASLVNCAETFMLDALSSGHTAAQAEAALAVAVARWQQLQEKGAPQPRPAAPEDRLRFVGSHDLVVELLPRLLAERDSSLSLSLEYVGSLGGLMALARGEAEIAGIHLWDTVTDTYNTPFVQRVLPGRRVALLGLVQRSLGLIIPQGNPQHIRGLDDLIRPQVRFVNRQPGSGTRVWLDEQLRARGVSVHDIAGYDRAEATHLAVARAVAEGEATVGLGIQAAGDAFALEFVPLTQEQYDLAIPAEVWQARAARLLIEVIRSARFREAVSALGGYGTAISGQESWVG
jgi:molybdate-binding protein/DNA-binding transcriptional regulator YhcF (GntR family)